MILGLTGGIASGKSTVARIFQKMDIEVVDADRIARSVTQEKRVIEELAEAFGEEIVVRGEIDRKKLREIVFASDENVKKINSIIHPRVIEIFEARREISHPDEIVIFDIPLLYEGGLEYLCDRVLVVSVPREVQINRIMKRDGSTRETAERIIDHQMATSLKEERADYIIRNHRDMEYLNERVVELFEEIKGGFAG